MVENRDAYDILVRECEEKRPLGIPKRRGEDNIGMDLREIVWKVVGWSRLAQDRDHWSALLNTVMKLWVSNRRGIS
jgi:hypothetical protein